MHEESCACCSGLRTILDRRRFVGALVVGGASVAFAPHLVFSAEGSYEAMVLACTELPLALNDANCGMPALDTTRQLAELALALSHADPRPPRA